MSGAEDQGAAAAGRLAAAREAAGLFELGGRPAGLAAYGDGHINESYALSVEGPGAPARRLLLQRINQAVFRDPEALMGNLLRVTRHIRAKLEEDGHPEPERRCLSLVPARDGRAFARDAEGGYWRAYRFIEDSRSSPAASHPAAARGLGAAVGSFQAMLADLPGPRLAETIPRFHDASARFAAFEEAAAEDRAGRAASVRREIAFFEERGEGLGRIAGALASGSLRERITHNDAKADNLLVDAATGEPLCLVDLDTVMPGAAAYDFGDLARTVSATSPEDRAEGMGLELGLFAALAEGYASEAASFLSGPERESLPWGARIIAVEQGLRFLADHLDGDPYYRIARPGQNLDRARASIELARALEAQWDAMRGAVEAAFARS